MKLPIIQVGRVGRMTVQNSRVYSDGTTHIDPLSRRVDYRIHKVRSNDFIVVKLDANGNDMVSVDGTTKHESPAFMYCDFPTNTKDGSETFYETPTGWVRTLTDTDEHRTDTSVITHEITL